MKKIFYKSLFTFIIIFFSFALSTPSVPVLAAVSHVVISQVQIAGINTTNDFVELYNPSSSPVDLNGYKLVKRTATGTSDSSLKSFSTSTIVPPHGYYLWANSGWTPSVLPDATTSATVASDNGVGLRNGALDTGTLIDSVAWGSATNTFVEGSAFATNPPAGSSIQRKLDDTGGHGLDTNNNSSDFEFIAISSPRNTSSIVVTPTETPLPTDTPSPTPTTAPTSTPTDEPTITPVPTSTPHETDTPSPTLNPTQTPVPSISPTPMPTEKPHKEDHEKGHEDQRREFVKEFHFRETKIRCSIKYVFIRTRWFFGYYPEVRCSRN